MDYTTASGVIAVETAFLLPLNFTQTKKRLKNHSVENRYHL
jgi:hypothetical protein